MNQSEITEKINSNRLEITVLEREIAQIEEHITLLKNCNVTVDWEAEVATGRCYVRAWDDAESYCTDKVGLLVAYDPTSSRPFRSMKINEGEFLEVWKHAEIATVEGVWRSFYGDECPVDPEAWVSVRFGFAEGSGRTGYAESFDWDISGSHRITQFCLLPPEWKI